MALRTRLVAGAAIPILLATGMILSIWAAYSHLDSSVNATLRVTGLGALGGAMAMGLAAWMYKFASGLAERISRLQEMARPDDPSATSAAETSGGDELDVVSEALAGAKDISKRHTELARSFDELQTTSRRTQAIAETLRHNEVRVADCLERLQRAERAITYRTRAAVLGELFAGVCRDFSEQLEFLLNADDSEKATVRLAEAAQDLQHRMSLYARLAGQRVRKVENFPLRQLLDETVLATEPRWKSEALASGASMQIAVTCPDDLMVRMDRYDLMEILLHLVDNAVDAMSLGGAILLEAGASTQGTVMLTVRDQGEGMGDEALRSCCQPFFSTREDSTGMGLAVVTAIALRNKVRFGVRSARGQGTTAVLEIPAGLTEPVTPATAAPQNLKPMMVLAVDDNAPTIELINDMLQFDGHVVDGCTDPRQAAERLSMRRYDVVICDRAMPHMSGHELARAVKAHRADLPVIMLTGFAEVMRSRGDMPPGVDLLLGKPFRRAELIEALGATMAKQKTDDLTQSRKVAKS